jgi:membrane-associated protease RseP (regulator of RpoE activity)
MEHRGPQLPLTRPVRHGWWLHGLLLVLTFLSLSLAGGFYWEGLARELGSLADLFDPRLLVRVLSAGTPYALCVLAILGSHEMGHYVACRRHGIAATLPYFIPGPPFIGTFGAVIRIRGRIPDRSALFDIAAAGPLCGLVVALPILALGLLRAPAWLPDPEQGASVALGEPLLMSWLSRWLARGESIEATSLIGAGWAGLLVTSLNLFPVGQLDGGHAAYAVSRRLHGWLSRATLVLLGGLVAAQGWRGRLPAYLAWLAILFWMRDRHPALLDESRPLGRGRRIVALLLAAAFALTLILEPLAF